MLDLDGMRAFLLAALQAGYAGERPARVEADGSSTIEWTDGRWRAHDSFFGGDPFAGRTIVFDGGRPVFALVYYGRVEPDVEAGPVYAFLREALRRVPEEVPLRGPREHRTGSLRYRNDLTGDLRAFEGHERIDRDGRVVYVGSYAGGVIAARPG